MSTHPATPSYQRQHYFAPGVIDAQHPRYQRRRLAWRLVRRVALVMALCAGTVWAIGGLL